MSQDVFRPVRLRDAPILRALEQFGRLYGRAIEIQVAGMHQRLGRIVQLANAKASELGRTDESAYQRAREASGLARAALDEHLKELKERKNG